MILGLSEVIARRWPALLAKAETRLRFRSLPANAGDMQEVRKASRNCKNNRITISRMDFKPNTKKTLFILPKVSFLAWIGGLAYEPESANKCRSDEVQS